MLRLLGWRKAFNPKSAFLLDQESSNSGILISLLRGKRDVLRRENSDSRNVVNILHAKSNSVYQTNLISDNPAHRIAVVFVILTYS